jgi:rhodanese-related sulfurtransferase
LKVKSWKGIASIAGSILLLVALPLLVACGGNEGSALTTTQNPGTNPNPGTTAPEVSEFDIVQDAVAAYLTDRAGNIKATDLQMKIAEGDAPYIVSLRKAEDYAKGHIPGAVNVEFADLVTLPQDEEIVVYCYTGQSASFGTAVLGVLGYEVDNLRHGMSSWTTDPDVYVKRFDPETAQGDYKVETEPNTGGSYSFPVLDNTASTDESEIVKAAAATVAPKYITAADLNMKIADNEDMTIVSVRSAEHYAAGHIPGAINIGLDGLADNLDQINPAAPVYVYCYTGHSAAQAAALLQMLGYDAYSLTFGMCSWTSDKAVNLDLCFKANSVQDYQVEK